MMFPIPEYAENSKRGEYSITDIEIRELHRKQIPGPWKALLLLFMLPLLFGCDKGVPLYQDLERIVEEYEAAQAGGSDGAYLDLKASIQSSQSKHDGSTEGTHVGNYRAGSRASFQTEIDNATTVLNDPASTDPDYDTARTTLTAANTTFDSQLVTNLDVFIFVDITGSMVDLPAIQIELANIIDEIDSRNSDARYAVIAHDGISELVEPTVGFNNYTAAQNAISSFTNWGSGEILVTSAIQTATVNYTWIAGSDRIAMFITDSLYDNTVTFTDAQNMLTSNNIISVACVDSDGGNPAAAIALFDGAPLNAYNAIPYWSPIEDVGNTIRSVLQNNIAYW